MNGNISDSVLGCSLMSPLPSLLAAVGKVSEIIRSSQPAGVGLLLTPPVMPLAALFPTSTAHPPGGGRKGEVRREGEREGEMRREGEREGGRGEMRREREGEGGGAGWGGTASEKRREREGRWGEV